LSLQTVTRERIVSAALWVGLVLFVGRASMAIQTVFVSRTFEREDVGLIAVLLMLHAGISAFTEMGHEAALIQRPDKELTSYINTAWIAAMGRGLLLAILLAVAAPFVADFYGEPILSPLIQGSALYLLVIGVKSLHLVPLTRTMRFAKPKLLVAGSGLVGLAVTIGVGLSTGSIWCVVFGGIAQRIAEVVGSHLLAPERHRFRFDWEEFKELFRYGRHIQAVAILVFLVTQLDDAVVGRVVSIEALGVYVNAYVLANLPMTQIVAVASQVSFPAWSQVAREGDTEVRNAMFLSTLRLTTALSVALTVAIFIGGADMIEVIFGARWRDAEGPLRILVFFGLWRGIGANFGALFNSLGRPDLILREISLKVVLIAATIYPMTDAWGLIGASWAVTLPMLVITPIAYWIYLGLARIDRRKATRTFLWPSIFGAAVIGLWWAWSGSPSWDSLSVLTRGLWIPMASIALCLGPCLLLDPSLRRLFRRRGQAQGVTS
jgi:lipopolysaccharide exporter